MSDPFDPSAPHASTASVSPGRGAIVRVEETIVSEGESAPPSSMRYEERVDGATFRARVAVGSSRARGELAGALVALFAAGSVAFVLGSFVAPIAATVLAWPRLVRALSVEPLQLELGPYRFVVDGKARGQSECATGELQGFGYRRSPRTRSAYDVIVLFRSGSALAVVVPCDSKPEARFLARRLNAALGEAQRASRGITASA